MKKFILICLSIATLMTLAHSPTTDASSYNIITDSNFIIEDKNNQEEKQSKRIDLMEPALIQTNNDNKSLGWSNNYFPSVFSEDIDHIRTINGKLRMKYMNRSELYQPFKDLEALDKSFVTQTSEEMILYANLTPEDFGIDSKYFINNSEKVYNSMLKDSLFGIDHGYFLGSLEKKELDYSKNEFIQISLILPKGSRMTRVGSLKESQFILPRDSTLSYVGKNFNKESKNVSIAAQVVDNSKMKEATKKQENIINNEMKALYDTPDNLVTLTPLGLNAGYVLTDSLNVISKSFELLDSGGVLSNSFFDKEKFNLTNGWSVHTSIFDRWSADHTLQERQQLFEEKFDTNSLGLTQIWDDKTCESVISFSYMGEEDKLPTVSNLEELSATLLHETFHYLIHSTNFFEDRPLFKNDPKIFRDMIEMLKEQEEAALVDLLNDDYAEDNWEEFICEAFMAKFHPNEAIRNQVKILIPQSNRLLDNLFDYDPPTVPIGLRELKVDGNSVKITFEHSKDNVGVDLYNIYQNGKLIKTEITEKDDDYLSYPDPGENQSAIEVSIDNLEQLTEYEFQITAVDDAQNESDKSEMLKVKTKDAEPPKLTGDLSGHPLTSNTVRFNWAHPTDNNMVKEVRLYRRESSSTFDNSLTEEERIFTIPGNENYYTDSTVTKGKTYIYYMIAVDEAGNESEKSNNVTIKTSDKNDEKQNKDKAKNTKFTQTTLDWSGAFDGVASSGFKIFGWFFKGSSWVLNSVTSVSGTATSALVSLEPGASHHFVVVPVDDKDNPLSDGIQISVDSIDHSSIKTKDNSIYVGQNWNPKDNFVSATDEDGNPVSFEDERISVTKGNINTNKPGVYEEQYSYRGRVKTSNSVFKVTVKEDKSSIKTRDSEIKVGTKWNKEDNFVSATDEDGNPVGFTDKRITINGASVDTSKVGVFELKYSFVGKVKTSNSSFIVKVSDQDTLPSNYYSVRPKLSSNLQINSEFKLGYIEPNEKFEFYYIPEKKAYTINNIYATSSVRWISKGEASNSLVWDSPTNDDLSMLWIVRKRGNNEYSIHSKKDETMVWDVNNYYPNFGSSIKIEKEHDDHSPYRDAQIFTFQ